MKMTKNPVFLHYFSKFMGIFLFVLKCMYISLLLKMINGFSWPAKTMASPFKFGGILWRTMLWTLFLVIIDNTIYHNLSRFHLFSLYDETTVAQNILCSMSQKASLKTLGCFLYQTKAVSICTSQRNNLNITVLMNIYDSFISNPKLSNTLFMNKHFPNKKQSNLNG